MADTNILTEDEVERALKDYNNGADLAACHIPALCQTVRALRASYNDEIDEFNAGFQAYKDSLPDGAPRDDPYDVWLCGYAWAAYDDFKREIKSLQSQLAAVTQERDALREQIRKF